MSFQVGDFVRFDGAYTGSGGRPIEPRNPRAIVTTSRGSTTYTPSRDGVGQYYIEVSLTVPGEVVVRFDGMVGSSTEVYSEQAFAVMTSELYVAPLPIPDRVPAAQMNAARDMMIEDLRAVGINLTAAHSDTVVASAHAAMLANRAESRRAEKRPRGIVPLRPLKR